MPWSTFMPLKGESRLNDSTLLSKTNTRKAPLKQYSSSAKRTISLDGSKSPPVSSMPSDNAHVCLMHTRFFVASWLLRNLKTYQSRHSGESRNPEDPWNGSLHLVNDHTKNEFLLSRIPPGAVCLFSESIMLIVICTTRDKK